MNNNPTQPGPQNQGRLAYNSQQPTISQQIHLSASSVIQVLQDKPKNEDRQEDNENPDQGYSPNKQDYSENVRCNSHHCEQRQNDLICKYDTLLKEKDELQIANQELHKIKDSKKSQNSRSILIRKSGSPVKDKAYQYLKTQIQCLNEKNEQLSTNIKTICKTIVDQISKIPSLKIEIPISFQKNVFQKDQQFEVQRFLEFLGKFFLKVAMNQQDKIESLYQGQKAEKKYTQRGQKTLEYQLDPQEDRFKQLEMECQQSKITIQKLQTKISNFQNLNKQFKEQTTRYNQLDYWRLKDKLQKQIKQLTQKMQKVSNNVVEIVDALIKVQSLKQNEQYFNISWKIIKNKNNEEGWKQYAESTKNIVSEIIEKLKNQVQIANQSKSKLEAEICQKLKNQAQLAQTISNLNTRIQQLNLGIESVTKKSSQLQLKYEQQIQYLDSLVKSETKRSGQLQENLSTQIRQLNSKIQSETNRSHQLQVKYGQSMQEHTEIRKKLQEKVETLTSQMLVLDNIVQSLNNSIAELREQKKLHQTEIESVRQKNIQLEKNIQQLKSTLQKNNTQHQTTFHQKSQLQRNVSQLQQQIRKINLTIRKKDQQIQQIQTQREQLKILFMQQQQQLKTKDQILAQKNTRISILQLQISGLTIQSNGLANSVFLEQEKSKQKDQILAQKETEIIQFQKQLLQARRQYEILQKNVKKQCQVKIQSNKKSNIGYINQIQKLKKELQASQKQKTDFIKNRNFLQEQNRQHRAQITKAQQKLQQEQKIFKSKLQKYKTKQQECELTITNLKQAQVDEVQKLRGQFSTKIEQLEAQFKQKNTFIHQLHQAQLEKANDQFARIKQQLNLDHLRQKQQMQKIIQQKQRQLQLKQHENIQLEQNACNIYKQLNQNIDQIRLAAQQEQNNRRQEYQTLINRYEQLQNENTLNVLTIQMKNQHIKQTQIYLQKVRLQLFQKDIALIQTQQNIKLLQNKIDNQKTEIFLKQEKRSNMQQEYKKQIQRQREQRLNQYNQDIDNLRTFYQKKAEQQEKIAIFQVESFKIIIAQLNEAKKLQSLVEERKQNLSNIITQQTQQQQKSREQELEKQVSKLNKIIKSLQKEIQDLQDEKQKISFELKQKSESLLQQITKAQSIAKTLQKLIERMQTTDLEQFLLVAQEQTEQISYNFSLIFANIRSHVQRVYAQNLIIQNQLDRSNNTFETMQKQSNQLSQFIRRLQIQLENEKQVSRSVLQNQQAVVRQKQKQVCNLQLQLNDKENLLASTSSQKDKIQRNLKAILSENTQLVNKLKSTESAYGEKQKSIHSQSDRIKAENMSRQQLIQNLQEQNSNLKKQLQKLRLSKQDAGNKDKDITQNLKKKQSEILQLKSSMEQLVIKKDKLEKQLKDKTQIITQLQLKKQPMQRNITTTNNPKLQKQIAQLKQENKQLKKQLQQKRYELEQTIRTIRSNQHVIQIKNEQINQYLRTIQKQEEKIKKLQETRKSRIEVGSSSIRSTQPLQRKNQEFKRLRQLSPQNQVFQEKIENTKLLFSNHNLLDKYKEEKQFLISSINQTFKVKCSDTNCLFNMNEKSTFKAFHVILQKNMLTQYSYAFLFCNKGTDNKNNIFCYATYKPNPKASLFVAILINLTKKKLYQRKVNAANVDALRYQINGYQLNMANTLKIKAHERKMDCLQPKNKYFDIAKYSEIFDREVSSVELCNMQIYQLQFE